MNKFPLYSTALRPLEDFFKNPEQAAFSISPDSNHIAFMQPWKDRLNVFVRPRAGGSAVQVTYAEARDIAGFFWANNQVIAFLQDTGGDENFSLYTVHRDGTDEQHVTPFTGVRVGIIDDLEDDEAHMIIEMNKRNPEVFDAYRINIETGELTMIAENPGNISSWMTDHDGKLRIAGTTDGVQTSLLYRTHETDDFTTVMETSFKDAFSPAMMTYDNKKLYVISNLERNTTALCVFNPETKQQEEVLYVRDDVDLGGIMASNKRKKLLGITYTTDKTYYHFFDEQRKQIQQDLEERLPHVEVRIASADKAEEVFIIRTFNDKTRGSYYLYDTKSKDLSLLAEVSPWIDSSEMSEMKPISYTARDGLTIHGYLTLPHGKEHAKGLPVIINPHGGPWARDYWGFNAEVQFLASRGYAVLQMNFRSSTGYGKSFWTAGFKQWGKAMQDDVTDGVKWLIDQGIADPKRVAIYGGSYGGYTVLAGITFTPELYCCGIDYVGVSNIFTLFDTMPPYWEQGRKMMYEMVGDPETEKELLTSVSPIFHIDNITCPLFVAQGANDVRVKQEHSEQIVSALREKNIDVEYMVKENEGHGFHNEENRFDFYRAMEAFLEKHL